MGRRVGSITAGDRSFVTTMASVDIGATGAPTDIPTTMVCPGDGAKVVSVSATIKTVGVGDENHNLILEHGFAAAGVALTPQFDVHAGVTLAPVGTIVTSDGLPASAQPDTVQGTAIQLQNTEEGAISTGAIVDMIVIWQL